MEYSTKELRERKALTDAIVENLETISNERNDLEELFGQTSRICASLSQIEADTNDLDELLEKTNEIVRNLATISENEELANRRDSMEPVEKRNDGRN